MNSGPIVSVVMANYRGARHLEAALRSVLNQTVRDVEVIVSDDCSDDDSVAIVEALAREDPRVELIASTENGGPGRARNLALERARGEWVAIVDSDDVIHPERFGRLILLAEEAGVDAIADDLLFFADGTAGSVSTLLHGSMAQRPSRLTAERFVRHNILGSDLPALGYLKPMFRRAGLRDLFYDEAIRIGEDYDFLLRYLTRKTEFLIVPALFYLYRRHQGSISHRLSIAAVEAMVTNQRDFERTYPDVGAEIGEALRERMSSLEDALAFERLVMQLKERNLGAAAAQVVTNPAQMIALARSVREGLSRRIGGVASPARPEPRSALFLGRDLDAQSSLTAARQTFDPEGRAQSVETGCNPDGPYDPSSRSRTLSFGALCGPGMEIIAFGVDGLHLAGYAPAGCLAGAVANNSSELAAMWGSPTLQYVPVLTPSVTWMESGYSGTAHPVAEDHVIVARNPTTLEPFTAN